MRQLLVLWQIALDVFQRGFIFVAVVFLATTDYSSTRLYPYFALKVRVITAQNMEQSRFAGAVATN